MNTLLNILNTVLNKWCEYPTDEDLRISGSVGGKPCMINRVAAQPIKIDRRSPPLRFGMLIAVSLHDMLSPLGFTMRIDCKG
jgi:hypothetical protein